MGARNKAQKGPCYALEAVFSPPRVNIPAPSLLRPESRINQGFFIPYRVTFARFFLMCSALCLRVIPL